MATLGNQSYDRPCLRRLFGWQPARTSSSFLSVVQPPRPDGIRPTSCAHRNAPTQATRHGYAECRKIVVATRMSFATLVALALSWPGIEIKLHLVGSVDGLEPTREASNTNIQVGLVTRLFQFRTVERNRASDSSLHSTFASVWSPQRPCLPSA